MPKQREKEFDVDEFLQNSIKKAEKPSEEETVIIDTEEVEEEIDFSQPANRVAAALINQEPEEDEYDWQTEQEIDLGEYNARRIKTERAAEVEKIKELKLENREQIKTMMDSLHGEEAAEVQRDENEKKISKVELMKEREELRQKEKDETNIVDVMMNELLTNYRPRDK